MTQLNPGDKVIYAGTKFPTYWDLELTVNTVQTYYVSCRFPEPERPGGYGLTTWIDPADLIRSDN